MKPVHQTRFGLAGNCVSAALASILELPVSAVPLFPQGAARDPAIDDWLSQYGYAWMRTSLAPGWEDRVPDVYHTMSGPSPRGQGLGHMVVGRGGEMVHDPHPDGTGILAVETLGFVIPRAE